MRTVEDPQDRVRLELKCGKCSKVATYDVGSVMIWHDEAEQDPQCAYTAYFRCVQCHSAGPWQHTTKSLLTSIGLLGEALGTKKQGGRLSFGRLGLFDGTFITSPAEGEDILRARLEREPGNAFLWCRLGNLLSNADQTRPAKAAYARTLEINDSDIEAHYRLGAILCDEEAFDAAAAHLHQVLRLGRTDTAAPSELRRDIVVTSLKRLFEMSFATNGRIKAIPAPSRDNLPISDGEPATLILKTHDIRSETDLWNACKSMAAGFLREDEARAVAEAEPETTESFEDDDEFSDGDILAEELDAMEEEGPSEDDEDRPIIGAPRIGRNDPCPCGSGKKFKKCCGRG